MNIVQSTAADAIAIQKLIESLARFYRNDESVELPLWFLKSISEREILNRISSKEFYNLSYKVEGELLGYISVKNNYQLYHLFVSEAHQRCGIASRLWFSAKQATNSTKYFLRSSIYAIPVYEKFGFKSVGAPTEKDGVKFQVMEYEELRELNANYGTADQ